MLYVVSVLAKTPTMAVTKNLSIGLTLTVFCVCFQRSAGRFCQNQTQCTKYAPFCCGHILKLCVPYCEGFYCKSDDDCTKGQCCNSCTGKICSDQCLTNNDCLQGLFCCTQRGSYDGFNECAESCYGKYCQTDTDCAPTECCKNGWFTFLLLIHLPVVRISLASIVSIDLLFVFRHSW